MDVPGVVSLSALPIAIAVSAEGLFGQQVALRREDVGKPPSYCLIPCRKRLAASVAAVQLGHERAHGASSPRLLAAV